MPKYTQFNYFVGKNREQCINQLTKFLKRTMKDGYKNYEIAYNFDKENNEHIIELKQ